MDIDRCGRAFGQLDIAVKDTSLTWVSEGKDFHRLRETLKAGEVFEIAMLPHGTPPEVQNAANARGWFFTA